MQEYLSYASSYGSMILTVIGLYIICVWWPTLRYESNRTAIYSRVSKNGALLIAIVAVCWIALCPVPWGSEFDRDWYCVNYASKRGFNLPFSVYLQEKDLIWQIYIYICTKLFDYRVWLFVNAIVYIGNYLHASYRLSHNRVASIFIAFLSGFAFSSYGINAIRTGMGLSFILLAYTYSRNYLKMVLCLIAGVCFHISLLLPALSCLLAQLFLPSTDKFFNFQSDGRILNEREQKEKPTGKWWKNFPRGVKFWVIVWIICLVFSLFVGQYVMDALWSHVDPDSRFGYLGDAKALKEIGRGYSIGFRTDFVAFSLLPIVAAWIYTIIFEYKSKLYFRVLTGYLIANSFWLLLIRIPYTDRLAYLSWYLMPILLVYPLTDDKLKIIYKRALTCIVLFSEALLFNFII